MKEKAPAIIRAFSVFAILAVTAYASKVTSRSSSRLGEIAVPLITSQASKYTGCTTCLNQTGKKYCVITNTSGAQTGACCSAQDKSSSLCNDQIDGVQCSNTFIGGEYPTETEQYMVCPVSSEVCGEKRNFSLQQPGILTSDVQITNKVIPPGHVCSYTIGLDQTVKPSLIDTEKSQYLAELIMNKPNDKAEIVNDELNANLLYYTRVNDEKKANQISLLKEECSQVENSCTEDVYGNRKFYVEEQEGKVTQIFLVLVNSASLNDISLRQSFSASVDRLEVAVHQHVYMWISVAWLSICMLALCFIAQISQESDASIALQKQRFLNRSSNPWSQQNKPPITPVDSEPTSPLR